MSISDADHVALLDAAAEVLIVIVDHHVTSVQSHIIKQFEVEKARENIQPTSIPLLSRLLNLQFTPVADDLLS